MRGALHRSGNSGSKQLAAIDQLLIAGIELGPAKKREAINRVLELVPEWTRGDCWKRINELRRKAKRAAFEERHPAKANKSGGAAARRPFRRLWTPADDDRLLNLAGYEPVRRIAQQARTKAFWKEPPVCVPELPAGRAAPARRIRRGDRGVCWRSRSILGDARSSVRKPGAAR